MTKTLSQTDLPVSSSPTPKSWVSEDELEKFRNTQVTEKDIKVLITEHLVAYMKKYFPEQKVNFWFGISDKGFPEPFLDRDVGYSLWPRKPWLSDIQKKSQISCPHINFLRAYLARI